MWVDLIPEPDRAALCALLAREPLAALRDHIVRGLPVALSDAFWNFLYEADPGKEELFGSLLHRPGSLTAEDPVAELEPSWTQFRVLLTARLGPAAAR